MPRDEPAPDPSPIRTLLGQTATRFGLDDALATGTLWKRWADVVGDDVAAHAQPTSLRAGVLRIRADSPVWAHEIGYLADEIKRRANAALGRPAVAEVRIWNGPGEAPSTSGTADPAAEARGRESAREPSESTPADDPLEAMEKARRAWLGRRRRGPR